MTTKATHHIDALRERLAEPDPDPETVGVLARGLRWQRNFDRDDLDALVALGEWVRGRGGTAFWEVERAVHEILCDHARADQLPFLLASYRTRGKHGDDRRRLALHAISRVAALTGDRTALQTLEEALSHNNAGTRGWAIGFLSEAYYALQRPLPDRVRARLRELAANDPSEDVRAEAANLPGDHHVQSDRQQETRHGDQPT